MKADIQETTMNKQLSEALDKVTDTLRQSILDGFKSSMTHKADRFLKDGAEFETFESYSLSEAIFGEGTYNKVNEKRGYRMMVSDVHYYKLVIQGDKQKRTKGEIKAWDKEFATYVKPADFAERLEKAAAQYADEQLAGFKAKMIRKLNALDVLEAVTFNGSLYDNSLDLKYKNGSFFVTTKVVYKRSFLGKDFLQYPTTFHNVQIVGKVVSPPSEAKVKRAFKEVRGADFKETVAFKIQEIIPVGFHGQGRTKTMTRLTFTDEAKARAEFKNFPSTYKRSTLLLVKQSDTEKTVLETRKQEYVAK